MVPLGSDFIYIYKYIKRQLYLINEDTKQQRNDSFDNYSDSYCDMMPAAFGTAKSHPESFVSVFHSNGHSSCRILILLSASPSPGTAVETSICDVAFLLIPLLFKCCLSYFLAVGSTLTLYKKCDLQSNGKVLRSNLKV